MSNVVNLKQSTAGKFQALCDALNKIGPVLQDIEMQFGTLGMVARVEKLLERLMAQKLGWNVKIYPEIKNKYVLRICLTTIIPTIYLSRRFSIDLIKASRNGDVCPVVKELKSQMTEMAHSVKYYGHNPFEESLKPYNFSYIVVEASTVGGCFHAAVPVNAISLVDTDDENQAYVAKEIKNKKDHFILKPTKEYLQSTLIKALNTKNLPENEKRNYMRIIKNGNYRIIKEHIQEGVNKNYKILGNRITISNIYNR